MSEFFWQTDEQFNLRTSIFQNTTFKRALQAFQDETKITSCFLGARGCEVGAAFKKSTMGWPNVLRISPIYSFEFVDIFDFLLRFDFNYCRLYNKGFTSLGGLDTLPNANLVGKHISTRAKDHIRLKQTNDVKETVETVASVLLKRGISAELLMAHFENGDAAPAYFINIDESESERSGRSAS